MQNQRGLSSVQRFVKKLGRYRIVAELARGGMGIVWLAEMSGPGGFVKTCVVKELLPELAKDPHHRAMFLDEASLAARLAHKNIVQTNEVGCDNGRWFMALELLEGCTLRRLQTLLGAARLAPAVSVRIVCAMLEALDYAHELRDRDGRPLAIVHRDVTPQNVLVTFDGQVKLLDFGVAKSRARREETREGFAKGNIAYMSPDHLASAPIDRRADIFAAGMVLRELLTGERVWQDLPDISIVARLAAGLVPELPEGEAVPAELRRICERAMAPARSDRFATAAQMREELEAWVQATDPRGSLAALRALFDGELAHERIRLRQLHRAAPVMKPPAPTELASTELVTDPSVPVPRSTSSRSRGRRLPRREVFVFVMALVASVAAVVSVTQGGENTSVASAEEAAATTVPK